ncbi:MAG: extracellular solute-binding protein [Bdellovibrionales bacterium]|nr:extracellular solute-binding protein [Bdellovibrionales bacterium]
MLRYLVILFFIFSGCKKEDPNAVWIYTSLYKDTIADIKPKLEKEFPELKFYFFQAGSEEIAAKVNAETLAGGSMADILISSDRFWYEELATFKKLHPLNFKRLKDMPETLRHPDGLYHTLSIPVMVMAYNGEVISPEQAPKTFKEMAEERWNKKLSTGSPLASGTNFTTVAFLSKRYGWDFFEKLQHNGTISQGGNSAVVRRIQSLERPVGWVLLENLLRFQGKDPRLKIVYPADGVVMQNNVLAITKKKKGRKNAERVAEWLFSKPGQEAMVRSYMYSPFEDIAPPKGAPPFKIIKEKAFPWSPDFVNYVVENRETIKEKFTEIMFN